MENAGEDAFYDYVSSEGGFGTIAGMYRFRHKTKKLRFTIGFPTILITEIGLVIYWIVEGEEKVRKMLGM